MIKKTSLSWDLGDILKGASFESVLQAIQTEIDGIGEKLKAVDPKMKGQEFEKLMLWMEGLNEKVAAVLYVPSLMESINQKDSQARLMKTKANDLALNYSQKIRGLDFWLKGLESEGVEKLDETNAKRLFKVVADLEYVLTYARMAAKHNLSKREEEILENKETYTDEAISDLRSLIEADMVYEFRGRKIKSQSELLKYVHSDKSVEREAAYRSLFSEHKKEGDKFFVIYQSVIKNWDYDAKLRGYESPIAMRNFANHVPDNSIEVLLDVCRKRRGVFQQYFRYKAKQLGKTKLNRFDLYAPIKSVADKKMDFDAAKNLVIEAFGDFSDNFKNKALQVFNDNHVDSHPKKNKRSGAFCATVSPSITPYVLMNYNSTLREVYTLAHELGHAIHSLYANKHFPSSQHANLPLSETASTFGEMILFEKLFANEKDVKIKKSMLWEKMSDAYATILRQNYFVLFEIKAHEIVGKGATMEELNKLYLSNLREQFGNSVKVEGVFQYEWMYISHIFESPFYCYAYNFGELLSLALWSRYKAEGAGFIPKLEKILETGGSQDPTQILSEVGVDVTSAEFWMGGFDIISGWQKQLEEL